MDATAYLIVVTLVFFGLVSLATYYTIQERRAKKVILVIHGQFSIWNPPFFQSPEEKKRDRRNQYFRTISEKLIKDTREQVKGVSFDDLLKKYPE